MLKNKKLEHSVFVVLPVVALIPEEQSDAKNELRLRESS